MSFVESFPGFDPLRDPELNQVLDRFVAEERARPTELLRSSYERPVLHGKIDIIDAELARRRRREKAEMSPAALVDRNLLHNCPWPDRVSIKGRSSRSPRPSG